MKRSAQINLCPYDNSFLRYVYMPWSVNKFLYLLNLKIVLWLFLIQLSTEEWLCFVGWKEAIAADHVKLVLCHDK